MEIGVTQGMPKNNQPPFVLRELLIRKREVIGAIYGGELVCRSPSVMKSGVAPSGGIPNSSNRFLPDFAVRLTDFSVESR
jgi:hypothetical protein